jgi:hypothetical protein
VFRLGVGSGYLDDAMLSPLTFLSSRRIGILPWIRGTDLDRKHGVDIICVNGIVFDKVNNRYRRVPYKTTESLRFFVLHNRFCSNQTIWRLMNVSVDVWRAALSIGGSMSAGVRRWRSMYREGFH